MKKIVNPCLCEVYGPAPARAFAMIEYDGKKLSICGVVGPMSNGNCKGSAGQCVDSIRKGRPTEDWTPDMLKKFCDIWERWHLNDMRATCEHQMELGWEEEAKEEVTLYHYSLTRDAWAAKKAAEKAAIEALRNGEPFTPTEEQAFFASLQYGLDIYETLPEKLAPHYAPKKPLYAGDSGFEEKKARGWVSFDESEKGILCKPCPICGYKYGTSWLTEEVPQDVIDWLFALPDTKVMPAWV